MNSPSCVVDERIVAFLDLTRFHGDIAAQLDPAPLFEFLSDYYAEVTAGVQKAHGEVIKFMGDAALVAFEPGDPDSTVAALKDTQAAVDALLRNKGFDSTLHVKAGIGEVARGMLGNCMDMVGRTVNEAALLPDGAFQISDQLKARL